jgi:hypothetical protein
MVGRDGVLGALAAPDGKLSLSRGVVQPGGDALVCDPEALQSVALRSSYLLMRHEQAVTHRHNSQLRVSQLTT